MKTKAIVIFTICGWLLASSAAACDVCGCSSSGNLMVGMPGHQSNFVGIGWKYLSFSAWDLDGNQADDGFMQWDLRGRFALNKRFQLQASIPYNLSMRTFEGSKSQLGGLGDAMLLGSWNAIETAPDSIHKAKHLLTVGSGLKLPTGKFAIDGKNLPLPANFQLGTGSYDVVFLLNYRYQLDKWGFNLAVNGRLNSVNPHAYQFGDQLGTQVFAFHWLEVGKVALMPYAGGYAEFIEADKRKGIYQYGTGGKGLYALAGLEAFAGDFAIGVSLQTPVFQSYTSQNIEANMRLSGTVSYLF